MEVSALLAEYRRRADDRVKDYYVDDEEAMRFASEAEREAAIRSKLLFDTSTPEVVEYTLAPGQAEVPLSPLVYIIDDASVAVGSGRSCNLDLTGLDQIRTHSNWLTATGRPRLLAHLERNIARLYPAPAQGGTLRLAVYRLPLFPLQTPYDEPEIGEEHHDGLIDWMLYRTWSAKDSEQEDPARADKALADFTARFGERPTASVMRRHRERRRVTTRMGF